MAATLTFRDFTPTAVPERTAELARNLDDGIFADADRSGVSVMEHLEQQDRSDDQPDWLRNTSVLQRLLLAYGVRMVDDHRRGLRASTVGELYAAGGGRGAILFPLVVEQGIRAGMQNLFDRFYMSTAAGDDNNALRPHALARRITADPLRNSILPLLVGLQELSTDTRPYNGFHMSHDENTTTMRRVEEFAVPAIYSISGTDRTHKMYDYAIELDISYKAMAEYALPALQQHLDWISQQRALVLENVAYDKHLLGDGSSAAATNTNVSALLGGVAGTVTHGNILEFMRLVELDPYMFTVAIGTSATTHVFDVSTTGSANHMTFAGMQAILAGQGARPEERKFPPMYARSYATANKMLFADASTLRMKYSPLLVERDRVIDGRFEKIVISESTGFDHLRDGGRRTLDTSA